MWAFFYPVRIFCLELNPGPSRLLWGHVRLVRVVWLIEAEDDGILGLDLVIEVIMPGSVSLIITPHHGDKLLALGSRTTAAWVTGAEILWWGLLMIRLHVPVIPPTRNIYSFKLKRLLTRDGIYVRKSTTPILLFKMSIKLVLKGKHCHKLKTDTWHYQRPQDLHNGN